MKKVTDIIEIITICALVLAFAVGFWVLPDRAFSGKENRTLEQFPKFTWEYNAGSGWTFTSKIGKYFADQFPLRDGFIGIKAYSELAAARLENNGVVKCGQVLVPHPESSEKTLERNTKSISVFAKNTGKPVTLAILPRPCDVWADKLPAVYDKAADKKIWESFGEKCAEYSLESADAYSLLCGSGLYYRTDHHYTTAGAYEVYKMLGEYLGYEPYSEDFFERVTVANDFCGTSMRTSGFYLTKKDTFELWRYEGDEDYDIVADGKDIPLYDMSKVTEQGERSTDKYAVFLGGNHSRVDITKGEGRPRLLLVRDSYADALAPFLSLHYDLTMLDPRYYQRSYTEIVSECDATLVLMSMEELSDGVSLGYLELK